MSSSKIKSARCILTTEKDAVKLRGRTAPTAPWAVVTIKPNWLEPAVHQVKTCLQEHLDRFRPSFEA